jgi:hypothetical protein
MITPVTAEDGNHSRINNFFDYQQKLLAENQERVAPVPSL